jgi:hypothetical protein
MRVAGYSFCILERAPELNEKKAAMRFIPSYAEDYGTVNLFSLRRAVIY